MARPVSGSGTLALLEEAVHLLRRTPVTTLVCHLLGTAPFALALLLYWNDVNNIRTSDSTVAREAMVLALLLVWMNCWRAVFAGRIQRQLNASPDVPWSWRRAWNLFACQAFLGASKLVVLPFALISIFGFAWTVAFYRSANALADRDDLDPVQVIKLAAHLANLERRQSWLILPIIGALHFLLTVNLAIALGMLPQLIRTLTGYESQFSRSGPFFVFTPLFLWSTMAISWMLFDPFTQAVYCLRSFRGESITTGADIRAGLRMIATAMVILTVLLGLPVHSWAASPQRDLAPSVKQAMQSPEYDWRLPVSVQTVQGDPWIVRVTNRIINGLKWIWNKITGWIDSLLKWLRHLFEGVPGVRGEGKLPTHGLPGVLYVLIAAALGLLVWLAWKRGWLVRKNKSAVLAPLQAIRLDDDDLTADQLPEESWLQLADQSFKEQNYRFALRAYYLANLAWLGHSGFLTIHAGKTNREYELELKRRARAFGDARALFAANMLAFESAWYGLHNVSPGDVSEFQQRNVAIKATLRVPQQVVA